MEFWHTLLKIVGVSIVVVVVVTAFFYAASFGALGALLVGAVRGIVGKSNADVAKLNAANARRADRHTARMQARDTRSRFWRRLFRMNSASAPSELETVSPKRIGRATRAAKGRRRREPND